MDDNQINQILQTLTQKMTLLKLEYERFINGTQKRPPIKLKDEMVKLLKSLDKVAFTRTESQFKLTTLRAHFMSYLRYLEKTLGEDNQGYIRDEAKRNRLTPMDTMKESESDYLKLYNDYVSGQVTEKSISFHKFKKELSHKIGALKLSLQNDRAQFDVQVSHGKIKITQIK